MTNNIRNTLAEANGTQSQRRDFLIRKRIRERYTLEDELAIQRRRDTRPEEFAEYNTYVEAAIAEVDAQMKEGSA